ncbi:MULTISPECIES: hypothetical protein [unclassified Streptosporangium]|uniref:hypothetical protein n=1 Tax=unclassified Streptosporangium TaxID=2632669 RepID=UPI002E286996|nr:MULTISPECIES: hypothetical protein [unclassified Streptosporangium]
MNVTMLPGGTLRVPATTTLDNGTKVDGTRDIGRDDPEYSEWLALAQDEDEQRRRDVEERDSDREILTRWRTRRSA